MNSSTTLLRLLGPSVHLTGESESLDDATREGRVRDRAPDVPGDFRLPVSSACPVELAAVATASALSEAGISAAMVQDLYYAWTYYQGGHFWSPAHALADRVGLDQANPIGIQQMCNGASAALQLADRMATGPSRFTGLIATGDVFAGPGFDRWSGDYGVLYGDAGTAMVVTTDPTVRPAEGQPISALLSVRTGALPHLESMHRDLPAVAADPTTAWPVRTQLSKKRYLAAHGSTALATDIQQKLRFLIPQVLAEAAQPITGRVHLPRLMSSTLASLYLPVVEELVAAPVALQDQSGHLGAGDLIANLAQAHADVLARGATHQVDLFISAGAGFTLSVAAIETTVGSTP